MRVVHVTSTLDRSAAGVREVVKGLAHAQLALGGDVAVLGLQSDNFKSEQADWGSIPTQTARVIGPNRFGYAPNMSKLLEEMNPDLVHLHGVWMHPGRSVLQWHRSTGKPYILTPHGMLSNVALSYSSLKKKLVSYWFQDEVFRRASILHVTSDLESEELRRYGLRGPICNVPNGVENLSVPNRGDSRRTILSLGRIHPKKALDHLVLAWLSLQQDFPDWNVLIVGPDEGGEVARLRSLIKGYGVERIEILEPVYGVEKVGLMANAGLFALPTQSENFAVTVAESLMLEVPVVSSHGAPWAGLERNRCGRWVPIGPKFMAEGLREMMSLSDSERHEMGRLGRQWMLSEFSWQSVAERLQDFYYRSLSTI